MDQITSPPRTGSKIVSCILEGMNRAQERIGYLKQALREIADCDPDSGHTPEEWAKFHLAKFEEIYGADAPSSH